MDRETKMERRMRRIGLRGALLAAALPLLLGGQAFAQAQKPAVDTPGLKRQGIGQWNLICQGPNCAIATHAVRAAIVFGFNAGDGALAMQVRLPTDAPQGRPVALRLHKSGAVLNLRVTDCQKTFCTAAAAIGKTEQVIDLFSKEAGGTVGYQLAQDMQLEVFSLNGFVKAMEELRKTKPKAAPKATPKK